MLEPSGIHHVTAIASDPQRNIDFYAGVLGLRLVKRTVNFDDPTSYHFYFGDEIGRPGSLLTFFPWPNARRGRQGAGQAAVTSFAIVPGSVGFWLDRLLRQGVEFEQPATRFDGERVIALKDPDGLLLELVSHQRVEQCEPRLDLGPEAQVPSEHAIRGVYSVTLWQDGHQQTAELLTDTMGFKLVREQGSIYRYTADDGRPGTIVDVRVVPGLWPGVMGAGTVHHVAFRAADSAKQIAAHDELQARGLNVTAVLDRDYFTSVYFREPGGVLFEIATDGPGFTVDESQDTLGRALKLPPWLEARRFEIEALLPNIHLPLDLPGPNA
ncbi:MAG: ring-cleaving dioxygenase [Gemmatimonadota bacterium]|nr:ring-cleaving dioxygenase [Gemmatimonadota bacterium]